MNYFLNEEGISLEQVVSRIKNTDLTPGIEPIKPDIGKNVLIIKRTGVKNLAELRKVLKNKNKLHDLSLLTGIDEAYLLLFRREIEGWVIKSIKIRDFTWLNEQLINKLNEIGLDSTEKAFARLSSEAERQKIADQHQINPEDLEYLFAMSALTRIRWVSPVVARVLIGLEYDSAEKIQQTDPEKLCKEIEQFNSKKQFYKGKIGERDIKRLINEAGYACL